MSMAAVAAIGSMLSVTNASAGCMSCGCNTPVVYASPCATYAAPVYAMPYYYAAPPMYVVNQGPAYTLPVPIAAEPTPAYSYPYVGATTSYYGAEPYYGYPRWHRHHHWARRYGYEGPSYMPAYRPYGVRVFRPHLGPGRLYGDRLHHFGPRFAHIPRARVMMPRHLRAMPMHMHPQMHMRAPMHMRGPAPGYVHPQGTKKPMP
jgi:hypothetical protein